jgi:hypothetical protein
MKEHARRAFGRPASTAVSSTAPSRDMMQYGHMPAA